MLVKMLISVLMLVQLIRIPKHMECFHIHTFSIFFEAVWDLEASTVCEIGKVSRQGWQIDYTQSLVQLFILLTSLLHTQSETEKSQLPPKNNGV